MQTFIATTVPFLNRADALVALSDADPQRRLEAARALQSEGLPEDADILARAIRSETDALVKRVLEAALRNLQLESDTEDLTTDQGVEIDSTARASATGYIARHIVHELRHFLARLALALGDIPNYRNSLAQREFERVSGFADAILDLGRAASPPAYLQFDLSALLFAIADDIAREAAADVDMAGPSPSLCIGDRRLVELIAANAMRNAVEATASVPPSEERHPITINWGTTNTEYWLVVLDDGIGPPPSVRRIFAMGVTTKSEHDGMGLAIAHQAARSLGGTIELTAREPSGARFEFRWPIRATVDASTDSRG